MAWAKCGGQVWMGGEVAPTRSPDAPSPPSAERRLFHFSAGACLRSPRGLLSPAQRSSPAGSSGTRETECFAHRTSPPLLYSRIPWFFASSCLRVHCALGSLFARTKTECEL